MKGEKIKILFFLLALCALRCGSAEGAATPQVQPVVKSVAVKTAAPAKIPSTVKTSVVTKPVAIKPVTSKPVAVKPVVVKSAVPAQLPSISQVPSPVQPQAVEFADCVKKFNLPSDKLFYLTLAAVNANRFEIEEIQSKSGYVLFSVKQKLFLASVVSLDSKNSMLKITPCDSAYFFPIGIVQNMFKYVELNVNLAIETLAVL